MCGIIACRTGAAAVDYLLVGLERLEYRGYDSVGVAVHTNAGGVARLRTVGRIGTLSQMVEGWRGATLDGCGIGHTRWATHGSVTEENAHPHSDCGGRISLVHNGVIENAEHLRSRLRAAGHSFASAVDSEVICHLIEDQMNGSDDLLGAVRAALVELEGSWAIAVLDALSGRIVVAAYRSPLLIAHTASGAFAASDIAALADWAEDFQILEDGDVTELSDTPPSVPAPTVPSRFRGRSSWRKGETDLNGYADHMAKEIDEQPEVAARLIDDIGALIANGSLWRDLALPGFSRVRVIGCGTSLNAGHVVANLVRRVGGVPATPIVASEAADEIQEAGTLILAISQSGETADVLRALETRTSDDHVLALTNNPFSTLARRADAVVACGAGPEIGVAATKTFVCQVLTGSALMISALSATGRISAASAIRMVDDLRRVPERLAAASTVAKCLIPPITDELRGAEGFVIIARGTGVPYAAEGALKLKELTYRWADHYPAGELKHGPLALVTTGTPVIVVDNGDPKLAANVAEVRARGGRVISIGAEATTIPVAAGAAGPWGPVESVIPMQILARTMALAQGNDVDKPRNLAKSVTVE